MRWYGRWAGNKRGIPENPEKCVWSVYSPEVSRGMIDYQCKRKRGHGPEGLFCKTHAKMVKVKEDGTFSGLHVPDEEKL